MHAIVPPRATPSNVAARIETRRCGVRLARVFTSHLGDRRVLELRAAGVRDASNELHVRHETAARAETPVAMTARRVEQTAVAAERVIDLLWHHHGTPRGGPRHGGRAQY